MTDTETKVDRLITASQRKVLEPEEMFDWESFGSGSPISLWGVTLATCPEYTDFYWHVLTEEQRIMLAREEVAAAVDSGIRMEAVLNAGLSVWMARIDDTTDNRVVYALHEIAEETRHSRAFIRLLEALQPKAKNTVIRGPWRYVSNFLVGSTIKRPPLLVIAALAGEEIPDLFQKMSSDNEETDPLLVAVNKYHRQEEARHISFGKRLLNEVWSGKVSLWERFYARYIMSRQIQLVFMGYIHPGVYRLVGLPTWKTWLAVHRCKYRLNLRYEATRPVLEQSIEAGVFGRNVPRGWRRLCGVDRLGIPIKT